MKYSIKIIIVLIATTLVSCNDFLVENPKSIYTGTNFNQNEQEVQLSINGIYRSFFVSEIVGHHIKGTPTDLYKRNNFSSESGLSNYSFSATNSYFPAIWQRHYAVINMCNDLIQDIDRNQDKITNYNRYMAQAKGIRAYLYFQLVRMFGDVPLILEPVSNLSMNTTNVSRTPQVDVFKQIIEDFTECSVNSMSKGDNASGYQYGRLTTEAAHGFLAKVYLWMGSIGQRDNSQLFGEPADNFQLALNHASIVIDSKKFKLVSYYPDLFSIKTEDIAKDEMVFNLQAVRGDKTGSFTGLHFGIGGQITLGGSWETYCSTNYHRMVYETSDSIRRLWNCPRMSVSTTGILYGFDYPAYLSTNPTNNLAGKDSKSNNMRYYIGKFRRVPLVDPSTYNQNDGMDEPLLRYADILLIYAEAYNEVNNGPGSYTGSMGADFVGSSNMSAFDAVNIVRKRARISNNGLVHENKVPRTYNLTKSDLVTTCVPDWKPGFYGYLFDNKTAYSGRNVVYTSDYQAFREEILWERGRELVAETNDRWCDLVRRDKLVTQIQAMGSTANPFITGGEKFAAMDMPQYIKPYHNLYPIPQGEIDVNRKLTQNPGY